MTFLTIYGRTWRLVTIEHGAACRFCGRPVQVGREGYTCRLVSGVLCRGCARALANQPGRQSVAC